MRGSGKGLNSRYGEHWKLEKVFLNESVSTILKLVVASFRKNNTYSKVHAKINVRNYSFGKTKDFNFSVPSS